MKFNDYAILLLIIMLTSLLVSCNTQESNIQGSSILTENNGKDTASHASTATPLPTYKPGYNCYGIPSSSMWQLYNDNGKLKDNADEIVIDIKNEYNIPQCITGIPFDERAKKLLIDDNGDLVSNWEEIVEQLKSEWLSD